MSVLAAAGILGAANLATAGMSNLLTYHQSRKSSKAQSERDMRHQALYDAWYAKNIYPKYQELDYEMAKRYAENSAKWEMQGLENAGLNPILAFSHGFGSAGTDYSAPSVGGSAPSSSSGSSGSPIGADFGELARDVATADVADKQADVIETEGDVKKATKDSVVSSAKSDAKLKEANVRVADATKAKIDAEADQIRANSAKTLVDARNSLGSQGMSSDFGRIAARSLVSPFDKSGRALYDGIDRKIESLYRSDPVYSGHSAKSSSDYIEATTGKRQADFERERQEIYRRMFLRSGR